MKKILLLMIISTIFAASLFAADEEPGRPEYTIKRCTGKIVIDGILDEADWAAAPSTGEFKFPWYNYDKRPETQKIELEKTEAKLLWDDDFLYIYYTCEDKHIWADHYDSDSQTYKDDCCEFFWNPDPAAGNDYNMFEMNCIGNLLSTFNDPDKRMGKGSIRDRRIMTPQIGHVLKGTLNNDTDIDEGWVLEIAIRFEDYPELLKEKPKDGTLWRAGLNRCGGMTNWQDGMWSPEGGKTVGSFHLYPFFGKLYFSDKPVK
jgi:hypothetical protein